jgi:hypothetical protein
MADDFKRIDQMMPKKKRETLIERARTIESCLDWCRNNNVSPVDAPTHPGFSKHRSIPISRSSPEEREKDVAGVLNWRRAGEPEEMDTPTDEFAKIDKMLPKKKGESPLQRAKDIENRLDWCRNNGLQSITTITIKNYKTTRTKSEKESQLHTQFFHPSLSNELLFGTQLRHYHPPAYLQNGSEILSQQQIFSFRLCTSLPWKSPS